MQSNSFPELYDLSRLRKIANGDEEFVLKMITMFIDGSKPLLTDMKKGGAENDLPLLHDSAHRMKAIVDNMGILHLKKEIRLIEKLAGQNWYSNHLLKLVMHFSAHLNEVILQVSRNELKTEILTS